MLLLQDSGGENLNKDEGKIDWKSWDSLTQPKGKGGMGFKDMELFNISLLAKQSWRMVKFENALWVRVLKGIYYPHTSLMQAKKGGRPSWVWYSIIEGRDFISNHSQSQVYNGESLNIWLDTGGSRELEK